MRTHRQTESCLHLATKNEMDREQIKQVIQYLEWRAGMELPLKTLFALIYLADRYHLRKHGQLLVGGHAVHPPRGYAAVDSSLPPINLDVADFLGLHPEDHDRFMIELDLA